MSINIGDKFYLSYCPAVKFKLRSISKLKDKTHTFEMITEGYTNKTFGRKPEDLPVGTDWIKFD